MTQPDAPFRRFRVLLPALFAVVAACGGEPEADEDGLGDDDVELQAGPRLGKADNAGIAGLPVNGNYAQTEVWEVENQWEETTTANAKEAGIAWPANSGLTWDEKYARWVESLGVIEGLSGNTVAVTNPWGKTIEAAKLDCADVALTLRSSFAAWYNLPFYVVSYDGNTPVYFGHFGIRTAAGRWKDMPRFAQQYDDLSDLGAEALGDWPQDTGLRKLGVQAGDDQPFLEPGARTGAWLDEMHLNKRAARFIRLMLIFNGSANLADTRNTFNLVPEAVREGDVNLHRWQKNGIGHTMPVVEVEDLGGGKLDVRVAEGSLPPIQPRLLDATGSALRLTSAEAGGADDVEDYASFGGGIKRFRVAKSVGGKWTNTWMAADEASWIDSSDLDHIRERPMTFKGLLGEVDPEEKIAALLSIVEQKREHLQNFPASCSARIGREEAFDHIYETAAVDLGMSKEQVDAMWRVADDYIFAELDYTKSKTCCWNSTNHAMYETIVDFNASRQEEAAMCLPPIVFKAMDGGYAAFRAHDPTGWVDWSEDESCPQRNVANDTEAAFAGTSYCAWKDLTEGGGEDDGGGAPPAATCEGACGGQSADASCWCDDLCEGYGDCCSDRVQACG
jgi:hypothetical protein